MRDDGAVDQCEVLGRALQKPDAPSAKRMVVVWNQEHCHVLSRELTRYHIKFSASEVAQALISSLLSAVYWYTEVPKNNNVRPSNVST